MKNLPLLIGTLVVSIALIAGIAVIFSGQPSSTPGGQVDTALLVDGANSTTGTADAPVTIVEFSDFQCPACKASEPMVKSVLEQYPDQVRLVFRNFPLDQIHPNARLAAQAAQAAQAEDKFWEYADLLFEKQDAWSEITSYDPLKTTLSEYASELGIDSASFLERMESSEVVSAVQRDVDLAKELNIMATPTFFVNGIQTPAPELLSAVKNVLDQQ
jgi:protein-disulfide isomerase